MSAEPTRHLFTVDDYHRMGEAGLFEPDQRLELLDGEIIEMSPIGIRHAAMVDRLARAFMPLALDDALIIRVQNPVHISDLSELQPEVTLLRWRRDFYQDAHPTPGDVLLMVEVSDTTAAWDRRRKRPLYAAAGVTEMWLIDLANSLIDIATDPGPEGYSIIRQVAPGADITPRALPGLTIATAALFG